MPVPRPTPSLTATESWYARATNVLTEGVSSPSRGAANYAQPVFMRRGRGSRLIDVDGNEYLDLMMAYGCLVHGHAHPRLVEVATRVAAEGTMFATADSNEVELAERLVAATPGVESVRFANTGTEATLAAVRLARGLTGRSKIIKFEGHYHGWHDSVLLNSHPVLPANLGDAHDPIRIPDSSGVTPGALQDTIVLPWGNISLVEAALDAHPVATVITEPVMANMGVIPPQEGFLPKLQDACRKRGTLMILDETVTGFRLHPGGAQSLYGVTADIVTFGKALGGGLPVAAIAGRREVMDGFTWGRVLHYGTHNASHLSIAVARESFDMLHENDALAFRTMTETGNLLADRLRHVLSEFGVAGIVQNVGPMLQLFFLNQEGADREIALISDFRDFCRYVDRERFRDFANQLIREGIFLSPAATLHSIISSVTSTDDVDLCIEAVRAALTTITDGAGGRVGATNDEMRESVNA